MNEPAPTITEPAASGESQAPPEPQAPVEPQAPQAPQAPQEPQAPAEPSAADASATPEPPAPESVEPSEPTELTPDSYDVPDFITAEMRQFAVDNKLTQEQFSNTIESFSGMLTARASMEQKKLADLGQQQMTAWGESADHKLSLAKRALKQTDADGKLTEMLAETGYGNHPAVLQFLHKLGVSMQEGGFLKAAPAPTKDTRTRAQRMFPNSE